MFQLQISAAADFWSDFGCGIHLVSGIVDDSPARRSLSSVFLYQTALVSLKTYIQIFIPTYIQYIHRTLQTHNELVSCKSYYVLSALFKVEWVVCEIRIRYVLTVCMHVCMYVFSVYIRQKIAQCVLMHVFMHNCICIHICNVWSCLMRTTTIIR